MPPVAILDIDGTLVDTNFHHADAGAVAVYRSIDELRESIDQTPLCRTS